MKKTTHILFTIYIFLVIWIILFKLAISIDQLPQFRSINLIPFYYPNKTTYQIREVLDNLIIFIPFGLYLKTLNIDSKRTVFLGFLFSFSLELSQYIFCIGASDITDLITNTTGALVGVGIYFLLKKIFKDKTNKIILTLASIVTFLFVSLIMIILINN
ncbi:MAG: VanZ family protein [Faecalibacillus sp.]|jgi:glycopeptide antibiotics resistance protein|uniref:VanZ family protein n=1 Tax=Faecalibacillus sp. TaxID=2678891 RepID=UPI00399B9EE5